MQTEKAYYTLPVIETCAAEIREIRPWKDFAEVILDSTIFYPEGGGQSGDRGTINGAPLLDVQEKDGEILHRLSAEDAARLAPGPAELALDVPRRRDLTVHHTGQHLLSGITLSLTGKPTVSMHIGEEVCTIDVDTPEFSQDTLVMLEEAAADGIEEDSPVVIHLCPPESAESFPLRKVPPKGSAVIRVVEIRGKDFSPCCGTHLLSTGQIGMLRILGAEKYKGMTRVYFIAGRRVLRDSRLLRRNGEIVSQALKVPIGEIGAGTRAYLEKTGILERTLKAREEELARYKAQDLVSGHRDEVIAELLDADIPEVLRIGKAAQKLTEAAILLGAEKDGKFGAFCSDKTVDLRSLLKDPLEAYGGKGGGGQSFFQGLFPTKDGLALFIDVFRRRYGKKV